MGSPPASTTPPPPPSSPSHPRPPPTSDASASTSALSTRPPRVERPVVHVDPATGKADGPHRKKLRTHLGIAARDKVDITYENWKEVPTAQKDLIWEDIQTKFDILEASDSRTKRKLLQTVGERWRHFKSDLTRKWALASDQDGVEDTVCDKYGISKEKWAQFCQTRRDPSWEDVRIKAQAIQKQNTAPHVLSHGGYDYLEQKLLDEKTKKLQEAAQSGSVDGVIDPPSPVRCHVKWKMARTKKTWEMTTEATKEIAEKIDSFEEQATQGSFVPHGRQDVLAATIGHPEHPGRVRAVGATADPADQGPTRGVHHRESDEAGHAILQPASVADAISGTCKGSCVDPSGNDPETGDSDRCGLYIEADPARLVAMRRVYEGSTLVHNTPLLPGQVKVVVSPPKPPPKPDPEVRWDATVFGVVNPDFPLYIKHEDLSKIAHDGQCLSISSIQRSGLSQFETESYIKSWMQSSKRDVYLGAYLNGGHWQMVVILPKEHLVVWFCSLHNRPNNYLKGIINSALKGLDDAPQPKSKAPASWIVVKAVVSPVKPPQKPDPEVDDPLYLMTSTITKLFLRPYQVTWDATMFGVFNPYFPLYIKHEDLSEIAHGGQCLSISLLQLCILHLTDTSMRAGNSNNYGFLEPQSIQRFGQSQFETKSYIKSWMQSSKRDVYLGAYLNGRHWQMVVIVPKEHLVVWFCSLHNTPDNYLKGIINSALKGLDDAPQPINQRLLLVGLSSSQQLQNSTPLFWDRSKTFITKTLGFRPNTYHKSQHQ
ncbi:hypothetical protein HKD37_04G009986 [Glycine soja]